MDTYTNTAYSPAQNSPDAGNGCLDWDSEISQESSFVLLEEGIYPFTVTNVQRERYNPKPGSKIPACNQARVFLTIQGQEFQEKFPLHTKMEWKLSSLYASLGMKQKGEPVRMNWPALIGRSGYCKIGIRAWKKDDGTDAKSNDISRFLAPWDTEYPSGQPQQPAEQVPQPQPIVQIQQQTMLQTPPNQWTAGKF